MFMAALAPLAARREIIPPAWDGAWFLENAVCAHRAAYAGAPSELWQCVGTMFKTPLVAPLLIPAGPHASDMTFLGVALFLLGCFTFALAAALRWMTNRVGAPFAAAAWLPWRSRSNHRFPEPHGLGPLSRALRIQPG